MSKPYPPHYYCPLGGSLMTDPVADNEGHVYERANIATWVKQHRTSPNSNR